MVTPDPSGIASLGPSYAIMSLSDCNWFDRLRRQSSEGSEPGESGDYPPHQEPKFHPRAQRISKTISGFA
jgi:hypothetical protein